MFSALRESSPFYILRKGEKPVLQEGQVQSVSEPKTKFGTQPFPGQYGMETVVDINVRIGDEVLEFKQLPSQLSIANFGTSNVVVSESRDAMLSEIEAMIRNSRSILDSVDYHQNIINSCEEIQRTLNPQLKKEKEQADKITTLETKLGGMEDSLSQMKEMLLKALESK